MTEQNQDKPQLPDAEAVAAYLRAHPEFFVDHDELILELRIPHQPGTAVSLVERQVKLLRERNIEVRHRLSHLMDVARDNDRLFDKTRREVIQQRRMRRRLTQMSEVVDGANNPSTKYVLPQTIHHNARR